MLGRCCFRDVRQSSSAGQEFEEENGGVFREKPRIVRAEIQVAR